MSAAVLRADASIPANPALFLQTDGADERWLLEGDNRRDDGGGGQSVEWSFDHIEHHPLMVRVRRRIGDGKHNRLVFAFLKAGVMSEAQFIRSDSGSPQGGIFTPRTQKVTFNLTA